MSNLNEAQSRRLDELLKKLYETESLDEEFLTNFFNHDKRLAYSYVEVLIDKGLAIPIRSDNEAIPAFIVIENKTAPLFLESGSFLALHKENAQQQRIRDLDETAKKIELLKFGWTILAFSFGMVAGINWDKYWPAIEKWLPW